MQYSNMTEYCTARWEVETKKSDLEKTFWGEKYLTVINNICEFEHTLYPGYIVCLA